MRLQSAMKTPALFTALGVLSSAPGGFINAFTLNVSTCDLPFAGSTGAIEFYFCSGGIYCEIHTIVDQPSHSYLFENDSQTTSFDINADVEPDVLVLSKTSDWDGWCTERITWESVELLASSTTIWLDEADGAIDNCQGGSNPNEEDAPCMEEWRFFNLKGDDNYELKIQACDGAASPPLTVYFCPDNSCSTDDVLERNLTEFDAGTTTFEVQLDFNPVTMKLSSANGTWCANASSFNGFSLASAYPLNVQAGTPLTVNNIQFYGETSWTPAPTSAPVSTIAEEEEKDDDVWFEALWEIVVTIAGGILSACLLGATGILFRRWCRARAVQEDPSPTSSDRRAASSDATCGSLSGVRTA